MKRLLLRLQRHHALRQARRRAQPALSVYEEMHRGSLIGLVICLLGAIAVGGHPGPALWAALFGAVIGALSGLLLWVGSDQLDEQPVIPPHRPGWRAENSPPRRLLPGRLLPHADSGRHPVRPRAHRQR